MVRFTPCILTPECRAKGSKNPGPGKEGIPCRTRTEEYSHKLSYEDPLVNPGRSRKKVCRSHSTAEILGRAAAYSQMGTGCKVGSPSYIRAALATRADQK